MSGRYTFVTQDAVESTDANFRMDEQDVTIFEGMFGGNAVKEFDLYNGKLSLSVGAEYVLADVSKSDDARYTLYGKRLHLQVKKILQTTELRDILELTTNMKAVSVLMLNMK